MTKLIQIVAPPLHPICNGRPDDWNEVEQKLRLKLPSDFKSIVNVYGSGCFSNFLYVFSPFGAVKALNLLSDCQSQILTSYREGQKEFPQYSPSFATFPDSSCLFPWATTVNGDTMFWLTKGNPDDWEVVICDSKFSKDYDHLKYGAEAFLVEWLSGKLELNTFPDDDGWPQRTFVPYVPKK